MKHYITRHLDLGFLNLQNCEHECLLFKLASLWSFVIIAGYWTVFMANVMNKRTLNS